MLKNIIWFLGTLILAVELSASQIPVVATVPELGSLLKEVGGERIKLTIFASGRDNPHYLEATPGFIKAANGARLLALIGLELEIAYLPAILQSARNSRILPGQEGYFDASRYIKAREILMGEVDRSMGDVHPFGNPHYLIDPINALKVAAAIRDRLSLLEPEAMGLFERNFRAFEKRVHVSLVGEELASRYDVSKLARLMELGKLDDFLEQQKQISSLKGWFGELLPYQETKVMEDHKNYSYFASRFGFSIVDQLEPRPGVNPGFKHLREIIQSSKDMGVRHVLVSSYFPRKSIQFLTRHSKMKVIEMAHQMDSRPETGTYLSWIDYNVMNLKNGFKD